MGDRMSDELSVGQSGQPLPPPPILEVSRPGPATGRALLSASWELLRADRSLLWLPAMATVASLVAALVLFVPGFAIGWAVSGQDGSVGVYIGGAFAALASSVVAIYFQAALVIGANQRADGCDPTLSGVLGEAWRIRARILKWAVLTTTVGVAVRTVERRLGILGAILGFLGGVAWAIASFLVVPILVVEDIGPIDAVKRSARLIRQTWGTSVRTTLRFGLIQLALILPVMALLVVGVLAVATGTALGLLVGVALVVAAVTALCGMGLVFSAVSAYARALIYRYATGRPVPGVDPSVFVGVFRQRRGRSLRTS